jgi:hypothetical protein
MTEKPWHPDGTVLLLCLLALALYLPGFTWGIPFATGPERIHAWGNDDAAPLAALAEMHDTFVVAPPNRNVAYPWFHYFLLGASCAPYLLYQRLTGGFTHPSAIFPFGFTDPSTALRHLSWIVRSWSIVLAVAAVLGAYYTAKHLWGRTAGFVSAIFTLLLFPMAYYAKLTNPDMPVLGWTSLTLAMFALCLRKGATVKRGAWFAAFLALAAATKDQSLGSFVFLVPVLLWVHLRSGRPDHIRGWKSIWAAPLATAASFFVVYVFASGIPVDPGRYQQHATKVLFAGTTRGLYLRHPATFSGLMAQARDVAGYLVDVMSWPLLLVAVAGVVLALFKDRLSLTLLLSSAGFFLMLLPVGMSRVHYSLPIALPLTAFAGYAVSEAIEAGRLWRLSAIAATAGIAGLLLLQTIDLTHDMLRDSRYEAGDWLDRYTKPGDRVMHFGFASKMPRLRTDVGQIRINQESEALPSIEANHPEFIVIVPQDINEHRLRVEWRKGLNSAISPLSPDLFSKLVDQSLGYTLVAKFETPRLMPWLNRPFLSYPTVNPPVQIFARSDRAAGLPKLEPWYAAQHYTHAIRVKEITVDHPGPRAQ